MSGRTLSAGITLLMALGCMCTAKSEELPGVGYIIMRGPQTTVKYIADMMKMQRPGVHLRLALDPLPDLRRLSRQLPPGTIVRGNHVLLPNGCDFVLVKARSAAWYAAQDKADDKARTYTRQELIGRLVELKSSVPTAIVSGKRPHASAYVKIGTLDQAIFEVPFLPTGARTIAVVPTTKMEIEFYRIGGKPVLPASHDEPHPSMRWRQMSNGRWEEVVNAASCPALRWTQRADGYWEEAAVPARRKRRETAPKVTAHQDHASAAR